MRRVLPRARPSESEVAAPGGQWVVWSTVHDLDGWTAKIAGARGGDNYRNTFRVEQGLLKVPISSMEVRRRFGSCC